MPVVLLFVFVVIVAVVTVWLPDERTFWAVVGPIFALMLLAVAISTRRGMLGPL